MFFNCLLRRSFSATVGLYTVFLRPSSTVPCTSDRNLVKQLVKHLAKNLAEDN